ncbi:epoxide hydrolase 4 isoform X1 [Apis mellifera]|uniref:Epoxide hydrolase 4 isoform X1 n=1 Tax=Apis mellifera TaxID=7460 RepID=A0A7M7TF91_APIME|nr:epoxide hydrolase 4 isoform X1 [Apis mellifera]|eukprot:XP_394354.4 epoxide hydrolase 4 isoform X1 [Apis mellifera]
MFTNNKIVHVSILEIIKLHLLSFIYGLYLIVKRFLKWIWDPKKFFMMQQRDKPPPCLIDNNLGIHSYIKIKNVKFHYVEAGNKNESLILLLHGFPDCWLSWRKQIPCLAKYYRVIAIDLKGFGDSDKPAAKSCYKIQVLIEELKQIILTFGVKQCSIIGHDLGGLLGWYIVALYGDMIDKFVAVSCPHPNFYWNRRLGDSIFDLKWIHFSRLPFFPEIDALKEDLSIINDAFQHLQLNNTNTEKDYVEAYKYAFSRKEDWTGAINYYRNLPFIKLNTDSCDQISTQTLLIIGNIDPIVTIENIVQSSEYIEKCNVKVISGAQHFPHQQKPDIVNEAILKFFMGTTNHIEKTSSKNIMSSWLEPFNKTVKYGNHMFDAVHKKTNDVVSVLPSKILYLGQTTN